MQVSMPPTTLVVCWPCVSGCRYMITCMENRDLCHMSHVVYLLFPCTLQGDICKGGCCVCCAVEPEVIATPVYEESDECDINASLKADGMRVLGGLLCLAVLSHMHVV